MLMKKPCQIRRLSILKDKQPIVMYTNYEHVKTQKVHYTKIGTSTVYTPLAVKLSAVCKMCNIKLSSNHHPII